MRITSGTLEIGTATDKIVFDPATKALSFSGTASLTTQTGWMDIVPFETGDDGANPALNVLVTGGTLPAHIYGREFVGNASQTRNRTYRFHIPHEIALNPSAAYFHLHWCHNTAAPTGDARFVIYANACQRDGTPIAEVSTTLIITPTAGNAYKTNMVHEVDISGLTGILDNLKVDAMFSFYVERQAGDAEDTFGNSIFVRGADMHVPTDGTATTSKDEGAGWAKVNV